VSDCGDKLDAEPSAGCFVSGGLLLLASGRFGCCFDSSTGRVPCKEEPVALPTCRPWARTKRVVLPLDSRLDRELVASSRLVLRRLVRLPLLLFAKLPFDVATEREELLDIFEETSSLERRTALGGVRLSIEE